MYNNSIKAENKIISSEDLTQIFQLMGETLKKYQKISEQEEIQNRMLDNQYQRYTFKDNGSKMKVTVDFYDNTTITFDKYENFMGIFFSRVQEIKSMDIYYSLSYETKEPEPMKRHEYYTQTIQMYITEKKMTIDVKLNSDDPKLNDVYNLIKDKITNAPEKYDDVIRKKKSITSTVAFATGFIPGMVITLAFLFIPVVNKVFFKGYVVYPLLALFLSYIIGNMFNSKLNRYYDPIVPSKKYAGYDSNRSQSVYEDDIDSFVETSEILIGNKVNNLENRRLINVEYDRANSLIKKELLALLIITVIVIIVGFIIK